MFTLIKSKCICTDPIFDSGDEESLMITIKFTGGFDMEFNIAIPESIVTDNAPEEAFIHFVAGVTDNTYHEFYVICNM